MLKNDAWYFRNRSYFRSLEKSVREQNHSVLGSPNRFKIHGDSIIDPTWPHCCSHRPPGCSQHAEHFENLQKFISKRSHIVSKDSNFHVSIACFLVFRCADAFILNEHPWISMIIHGYRWDPWISSAQWLPSTPEQCRIPRSLFEQRFRALGGFEARLSSDFERPVAVEHGGAGGIVNVWVFLN